MIVWRYYSNIETNQTFPKTKSFLFDKTKVHKSGAQAFIKVLY